MISAPEIYTIIICMLFLNQHHEDHNDTKLNQIIYF